MENNNLNVSIDDAKSILNDMKVAEIAYGSANKLSDQVNVRDRINKLSGMIDEAAANQEKQADAETQVKAIFGIK